jgi:hypothetical protein
MSDIAVQVPAEAASETAPAAEPKPGTPKPSRFRTDASLANDPLLNPKPIAPIRDTPPKDPSTGKFVKQSDPNAGVIPELQQQEQREEAPREEAPPAAEPTLPEAPSFTPVEIDMGNGHVSVFRTKEALEQHLKRISGAQSAAERRAAELAKEVETRTKAAEPPQPAAPEFKNPFETSLIDDEGLLRQMYADIDDPDKGPVVAVARVVDRMEKKVAELVKYIQHQHEQANAPMQQFLGAMAQINETAEFFSGAANATLEDGSPRFPGIQNRKAITDLTRVMHKHNLALTPENFELAYQVWKGTSEPGVAQPSRVPPLQDHTAAASAAAVMSGRGTRVPDPRAERRTPSFREEMDAVPMNRGKFRTV